MSGFPTYCRSLKSDAVIAKNYLSENEIDSLNGLVVIFLETTELPVKERKDISITFRKENVDKMLIFSEKPILKGIGNVSNKQNGGKS